ncbi:biotin biosynthesis protein BioH [Rhodopirellula sp. SWK7]|nr:biotin biosynthesis protein BioH [Rhodopirellula sp. SWK7]
MLSVIMQNDRMKTKLFLVSGWAFGEAALAGVAEPLASEFDVTRLAAEDALPSGKLAEMLPSDQPCVLVGWSLGGMLALEAAEHLAEGSMLVLIGSTAKFTGGDETPHGVPVAEVRSMSILFRRQPQETLANFLRQSALPHEPLADVNQTGTDQDDCPKLLEGLKYLRDADLRDAADRVGVATLILHGADDRVISPAASADLSRRISGSRLKTIDDVGHDLPVRNPQWIASNLLEFWKNDVARPDAG